MAIKSLWISVIAIAASFTVGFLLANTLNRSKFEALIKENEHWKNAASGAIRNGSDLTLSNDEIQKKIAEADQYPHNFEFQKNLGLALYRYAALKQDIQLLWEAIRILQRGLSLDKNDYDLQVGVGNAYFDVGYFQKDNAGFEKAREYYLNALVKKPGDVEVRTDLGLSYYLQQPPDLTRAAAEFEESLKTNPKHEKTLQFLIQALIKQNRVSEAAKYLDQLKIANPANQSIAELNSLITQTLVTSEK